MSRKPTTNGLLRFLALILILQLGCAPKPPRAEGPEFAIDSFTWVFNSPMAGHWSGKAVVRNKTGYLLNCAGDVKMFDVEMSLLDKPPVRKELESDSIKVIVEPHSKAVAEFSGLTIWEGIDYPEAALRVACGTTPVDFPTRDSTSIPPGTLMVVDPQKH